MVDVKALLFDVQGTLTDFVTTLQDHGQRILAGRIPAEVWDQVITDWRSHYRDSVSAAQSAGRWESIAAVYRRGLVASLARAECLSLVTDAEIDSLTRGWETLRPWPEVPAALERIRRHKIVAPLSNADHSALVSISRRSGLVWDSLFSAEILGCFKPDARAYIRATRLLGVEPRETLMVASHKYDLDAAQSVGLRTAFIARPLELGPNSAVDVAYEERFDLNVDSLVALAHELGCTAADPLSRPTP